MYFALKRITAPLAHDDGTYTESVLLIITDKTLVDKSPFHPHKLHVRSYKTETAIQKRSS